MIELPLDPYFGDAFKIALVSIFTGFGTGIYFMIRDSDDALSVLTPMAIGITVGIVIVVFYSQPIVDEYKETMNGLIDTVDCTELEYIGKERPSYQEEVIDEIITRCIPGEHTPKLLELLK